MNHLTNAYAVRRLLAAAEVLLRLAATSASPDLRPSELSELGDMADRCAALNPPVRFHEAPAPGGGVTAS
jgi:hypothetical protein